MVSSFKLTRYGLKVKVKLCEIGMTQATLAAMIGCTPQYLSKIPMGKRSGRKYMDKIDSILFTKEL